MELEKKKPEVMKNKQKPDRIGWGWVEKIELTHTHKTR
jgi:hypothetical protein